MSFQLLYGILAQFQSFPQQSCSGDSFLPSEPKRNILSVSLSILKCVFTCIPPHILPGHFFLANKWFLTLYSTQSTVVTHLLTPEILQIVSSAWFPLQPLFCCIQWWLSGCANIVSFTCGWLCRNASLKEDFTYLEVMGGLIPPLFCASFLWSFLTPVLFSPFIPFLFSSCIPPSFLSSFLPFYIFSSFPSFSLCEVPIKLIFSLFKCCSIFLLKFWCNNLSRIFDSKVIL